MNTATNITNVMKRAQRNTAVWGSVLSAILLIAALAPAGLADTAKTGVNTNPAAAAAVFAPKTTVVSSSTHVVVKIGDAWVGSRSYDQMGRSDTPQVRTATAASQKTSTGS